LDLVFNILNLSKQQLLEWFKLYFRILLRVLTIRETE